MEAVGDLRHQLLQIRQTGLPRLMTYLGVNGSRSLGAESRSDWQVLLQTAGYSGTKVQLNVEAVIRGGILCLVFIQHDDNLRQVI